MVCTLVSFYQQWLLQLSMLLNLDPLQFVCHSEFAAESDREVGERTLTQTVQQYKTPMWATVIELANATTY